MSPQRPVTPFPAAGADASAFASVRSHLALRSLSADGRETLLSLAAAGVDLAGSATVLELADACAEGAGPEGLERLGSLVARAAGDELVTLVVLAAIASRLGRLLRSARVGRDELAEAESEALTGVLEALDRLATVPVGAAEAVHALLGGARRTLRRHLRLSRRAAGELTRSELAEAAPTEAALDVAEVLDEARWRRVITDRQLEIIRESRLAGVDLATLAARQQRSLAALRRERRRGELAVGVLVRAQAGALR